jgi:hypothetical protein
MGFLNHIRVLNIKIISQINLFLIFLKKTVEKYKIKSNFMCFSVALFYNYFYVENELSCVGKAIAQKNIHISLNSVFEDESRSLSINNE